MRVWKRMRAGVCACVHVHVCMFSYMYIHTYVNVLFYVCTQFK